MLLLPALLVCRAPLAWAAPEGATDEQRSQTADERLDQAIRTYLSGELAEARNLFLVLVNDPEVQDQDLLQEARVWLGEVQFLMGETEAAEATFRTALAYDPDLRIDTFDHPPEVVTFFNQVRAQVQITNPVRVPDTDPIDVESTTLGLVWLALPGGVQFYNQQPVWGGLTLATVSITAASTLGLSLYLRQFDEISSERGIQIRVHPAHRQKETIQALQRTRALQWSLASVGIMGWSASLAIGLSQRANAPRISLIVSPTALGVSAKF